MLRKKIPQKLLKSGCYKQRDEIPRENKLKGGSVKIIHKRYDLMIWGKQITHTTCVDIVWVKTWGHIS